MLPSTPVQYRPWHVNPRYLAGEDGSVLGPSGCRVGSVDPRTGYVIVSYRDGDGRRTSTGAHSIVCAAWHGPRPVGQQAAHGNGVRDDNRPENLRWAPPPVNAADRVGHGTNGMALDVETVQAIRADPAASRNELADRYGVHPTTISHIRTGRTWRALPVMTEPAAVA